MTKQNAIEEFNEFVLPSIIQRENKNGGRKDIPMRREAWNNFTDALCKEGRITEGQYETWSGPF